MLGPTWREVAGCRKSIRPTEQGSSRTNPESLSRLLRTRSPTATTTRRPRVPRRWLPWAAIGVVAAIALAIALPLTLGGSSSSTTPPPSVPARGTVTGTYLTTTVQDSRLVFASLVESGSEVSGALTVTTTGPAHKHLVTHLYTVTGTVSGSTLDLTLTSVTAGVTTLMFPATYAAGSLTATFGLGTTLTLQRGTLTLYRQLVKQDRAELLS